MQIRLRDLPKRLRSGPNGSARPRFNTNALSILSQCDIHGCHQNVQASASGSDPNKFILKKSQRILWRNNSGNEVDTYELLTITYGTSAASFLATRCLIHLAEQHSSEFPLGSICVKRDFYVDDLLTRADSICKLEQIRDEIIQLLRALNLINGRLIALNC